jgi:AcrR family transcriptional regulator
MTTPDVRRAGDGSGKITREAVLAAALEIIDRDGADALSMRRLARALDRDPMIIYRHAPGKAALLDGVAETVLGQLQVDCADPDWAGQLREVARRYRALALAHPHVVPLIVTRPLATPLGLRPGGTLRPLEDILVLLTRAGFSGPDALHIYRALFGFLHGHVLDELQELVENPDETDDLLRLGLHRLPIGEFPLLRGLASALAAYDGAAELERGLDILLTGLTTTLPPPGAARPPAPPARAGTAPRQLTRRCGGPAVTSGWPGPVGMPGAGTALRSTRSWPQSGAQVPRRGWRGLEDNEGHEGPRCRAEGRSGHQIACREAPDHWVRKACHHART